MDWVAFRTLSNFPRLLKLLEHTRCWILSNRIGRNLRRSWNREKTFYIRNIFLCISHICFPNIFLIKKFDSFEKYNVPSTCIVSFNMRTNNNFRICMIRVYVVLSLSFSQYTVSHYINQSFCIKTDRRTQQPDCVFISLHDTY